MGLWLLIIGISVHDGYLVLVNRMWMGSFEQNPLGRLLLNWNGGDVWLLLATKTLGTLCAAALLLLLYWAWPRAGWAACTALATLQVLLLLYLYI